MIIKVSPAHLALGEPAISVTDDQHRVLFRARGVHVEKPCFILSRDGSVRVYVENDSVVALSEDEFERVKVS